MLEDAAILVAFFVMGVAIGLLLGVAVTWDRAYREGEASIRHRVRLDWTEEALR